ncbi:MAG TPA: hypothetical protein VGL57_06945 [Solirubrobacteraceae bacterium]|jgi:hypothetical protein
MAKLISLFKSLSFSQVIVKGVDLIAVKLLTALKPKGIVTLRLSAGEPAVFAAG